MKTLSYFPGHSWYKVCLTHLLDEERSQLSRALCPGQSNVILILLYAIYAIAALASGIGWQNQ